ncbi:MAG: AMP-binding protein, partial [Bacteroidales bacterium]|nr:AMP-binding protein [Bacteroidales bacterium]
MESIERIFDLLPHYAEHYPEKDDAIAGKEGGQWVKYNINQYIDIVDNISYGLFALGIGKGDKIATISNNCPEWNFLDMGILQTGAIHVPIYPTISETDYKYILSHSEVKYVFVSGQELLRKIEHIFPAISNLIEVFTIREQHGYRRLEELIELGRNNPVTDKLKTSKDSIQNQDTASIIYTSGTTGSPKGVMLTHNNLISNFIAVSDIPPVGSEAKAISYLPLCHVYERMLNYMYQYLGISIYYAESLAKIADNIKEIEPEILTTVPRLLEKIYDKIIAKGRKLKGLKKQIFFWSVNLGLKYELQGKSWWYKQKLKVADKLVFQKWRKGLGGNLAVIVSGGAALQPRLLRIFWAAGIPIIEGYGLTETSPVIAVSHFGINGIKIGTVGPVLKGVDVKIADDGEILAKGPNVMKGYYRDEALTREAIDSEGFFYTGDIGHLEPEGQLKITGRKKAVYKTSFRK